MRRSADNPRIYSSSQSFTQRFCLYRLTKLSVTYELPHRRWTFVATTIYTHTYDIKHLGHVNFSHMRFETSPSQHPGNYICPGIIALRRGVQLLEQTNLARSLVPSTEVYACPRCEVHVCKYTWELTGLPGRNSMILTLFR